MLRLKTLLDQHSAVNLVSSRELYPEGGKGLPLLKIETALCTAVISLQGAQLLSFKPTEGAELLWLSPKCQFESGASLRGGIPLCLPWFGVNRDDPGKPKHGFARNSDWQLENLHQMADGGYELLFQLDSEPNSLFDYAFRAQLRMTLGHTAGLDLTVINRDQRPFACSWALHSYFPVSDLDSVRVKGLAGRDYLDNLEAFARKRQTDDLAFVGEVDRVYPGVDNALEILGRPCIKVTHHQCPSVITWNPGAANAAKMADVGVGREQDFICVERGAVLDEQWHLAPGQSRSGGMEIAGD